MPVPPPARVRATKATRHRTASTPVCSASPAATPATFLSVLLRARRCGAAVELGGAAGRAAVEVVEVMSSTCAVRAPGGIRDRPGRTPTRPGVRTQGDHRCATGGHGDTIDVVTTSTAPPAGPAERLPDGGAPRPPLVRPRSGRGLAGVASGTAAHLRLDPMAVRVVFVALVLTGIGVVAYALLWLTMPVAAADGGAAEAGIGGQRPSRRQLLGLAVLAFVAVGLVSRLASFGGSEIVLPLVLAGI